MNMLIPHPPAPHGGRAPLGLMTMRSSNPFAARGRGYLSVMRFFAGILLVTAFAGVAVAQQNATFTGRVTDAAGRPAEGAMVFVYGSRDVRRPADFISAPTDREGNFRTAVPPGKYWAVARLKKTEGFGPLMPGDRHSGEPQEVEFAPGQETEMQFVVVDLKEAMESKRKDREGPVRISGRILDEKGLPVRGAYAIANKSERIIGFPDYLSAWVDAEGRYTLVLLRGRYYIGSALAFPPGDDAVVNELLNVEADMSGRDLVRRGP